MKQVSALSLNQYLNSTPRGQKKYSIFKDKQSLLHGNNMLREEKNTTFTINQVSNIFLLPFQDLVKSNPLLELQSIKFDSTQSLKQAIKLIRKFINDVREPIERNKQICDYYGYKEIISLFLKVDQFIKTQNINQNFQGEHEMIVLQHILLESLNQLQFEVNKSSNEINYVHEVLKFLMLLNSEQISGHTGRLDDLIIIFNEQRRMTKNKFLLSEDLLRVQELNTINLDELQLQFNTSQLKEYTIEIYKNSNLKSLQQKENLIKIMHQCVNFVHSTEESVFPSIRNQDVPDLRESFTLVLSYLLLAELGFMSHYHGLKKYFLESLGKSLDYSVTELNKGFIKNAVRITSKYLKHKDNILVFYEKLSAFAKELSQDKDLLQKVYLEKQQSIIMELVCDQLNMKYLISSRTQAIFQYNEMIQSFTKNLEFDTKSLMCSPINGSSLRSLISPKRKESIKLFRKRGSLIDRINDSQSIDQNTPITDNSKNLSFFLSKRQLSRKRFAQNSGLNITTQVQGQNQDKSQISAIISIQEKVTNRQQKIQKTRVPELNLQDHLQHGDDSLPQQATPYNCDSFRPYEFQEEQIQILRELQGQQTEICKMIKNYKEDTFQMNEQKNKNITNDKLEQKIEELEKTIQQIRSESQKQKQQKDSRGFEIQQLKEQIAQFQEKQKKVEDMIKHKDDFFEKQNQDKQNIFKVVQSKDFSPQAHKSPSQFSNIQDLSIIKENIESVQNTHEIPESIAYFLKKTSHETIDTYSKYYNIYQSQGQYNVKKKIFDHKYSHRYGNKNLLYIKDSKWKLKLQIAYDEDNSVVDVENLSLSETKNLLTLLQVHDILPSNTPLESIQSCHQFFKQYIMPFIVLKEDETNKKKIQIWPKAPGMLQGLELKIEFLDANCVVLFHHLEADQFRIIICESQSLQSLNIDVELDYSSMDFLFKDIRKVKDEYINHQRSRLIGASEKVKQEDNNEQDRRVFTNSLILKASLQLALPITYATEDLVISKPQEILKLIQSAVKTLEKLITNQGHKKFSLLTQHKRYIKYKAWGNCLKGQIQVSRDINESKFIEISLLNFHETFGVNKTKIRAMGIMPHKYKTIQSDLGINFEEIHEDEKIAVQSLILQTYSLNTHDKPVEQQSQEMIDRNPIITQPLDCGAYRRVVYSNEFIHSPFTISVLGAKRRMLGVKICHYDVQQCREIGMFFTTTQDDWDTRDKTKIFSNIKPSVENIPFSEYLITQIIQEPIIMKIFRNIYLQNFYKKRNSNHLGVEEKQYFITKLENIINFSEIYRYM